MLTKCVYCTYSTKKRTNNDHSFQIGRYQSRATCFGIKTSANASVMIMSNHVTLNWYLGIWNSRSILILIIRCSCQWFAISTTRKPPVRSVLICSVNLIEQADTAIVFLLKTTKCTKLNLMLRERESYWKQNYQHDLT